MAVGKEIRTKIKSVQKHAEDHPRNADGRNFQDA